MNDQKLLNSLMDFSDLRRKNDDFLHTSKHNEEDYNVTADEAIMKSFKELREKLKMSIKDNNNLKEDIKIQNIKMKQTQQNLEDSLQSNFELKDKVSSLTHTNEDLKKKIMMMKESLQKQKSLQQDLQFTKSSLLQIKLQRDELMSSRQKLVELSIEEKMGMEEQINKFKAKSKSDDEYIEKLEGDFSKSREKIMKLQNEIKKMSITRDEQTFSHQWARQNFETQHLQQIIKDLEKEIQCLKGKNKKEKQRKQLLEERIIELQEFSGLNNVKAETYCGEIEVVHKKYLKSEKKLNETRAKLDKMKDQKLNLQEKYNKLLFLGQELAGKVKRQNIIQINEAIREYELGFKKLKQGEIQTNSLTLQETQKTNIMSGVSSQRLLLQQNFNSQSTEPLYNRGVFYEQVLTQNNRNYSRKQSASSAPKKSYQDSRMTFGQREENQWNENNAIENRIRREREEMEKKLKEKLLCRRIETTASSEHHRLRNDYIRSYVDKRY